jgi:glutathione S-transferase
MPDVRQESPIELYVVSPGWGVPFASSAPFPLKLETWLRMTGLRYEVKIENDTRKGPKKKTPWIVDRDVRMGDSELIIDHLRRTYRVDPDDGMSPRDRAIALAWHRTFEEHYHQAFEHQLFFGHGGDARIAEALALLPAFVRPMARVILTRSLRSQLYARGLGRHDEATLIAMGKADLDAASSFLGDRPYFLGDEPRTVDACLFGFLGVSIYVKGDNPLFRYAASLENLARYTERMRERFFPETLTHTRTAAQ